MTERRGKALAALVPVERLEQMRGFARQHALEFAARQQEGSGNRLTEAAAMSVALDGQRAARRRLHKAKVGPRRTRV